MPKVTSKSSLQLTYKSYTKMYLFFLNLVKLDFIFWRENCYLLQHNPQLIRHQQDTDQQYITKSEPVTFTIAENLCYFGIVPYFCTKAQPSSFQGLFRLVSKNHKEHYLFFSCAHVKYYLFAVCCLPYNSNISGVLNL